MPTKLSVNHLRLANYPQTGQSITCSRVIYSQAGHFVTHRRWLSLAATGHGRVSGRNPKLQQDSYLIAVGRCSLAPPIYYFGGFLSVGICDHSCQKDVHVLGCRSFCVLVTKPQGWIQRTHCQGFRHLSFNLSSRSGQIQNKNAEKKRFVRHAALTGRHAVQTNVL